MSGTSRSGGDRVANGSDTFPVDGLPAKPESFEEAESGYWDELLKQIPHELLRKVDCHQLRTLAECMAMRDRLWITLQTDLTDKTIFSHYMRTVQQIQRLSPVFGLGPIDRRRMKLSGQPEEVNEDEWSD